MATNEMGDSLTDRAEHSAVIVNCQFKFNCDQNWELMRKTTQADRRYCGQCQRDVFECTSLDDVRAHALLGHCVAIFVHHTSTRLIGEVAL